MQLPTMLTVLLLFQQTILFNIANTSTNAYHRRIEYKQKKKKKQASKEGRKEGRKKKKIILFIFLVLLILGR